MDSVERAEADPGFWRSGQTVCRERPDEHGDSHALRRDGWQQDDAVAPGSRAYRVRRL
jgi:hypothetical protein